MMNTTDLLAALEKSAAQLQIGAASNGDSSMETDGSKIVFDGTCESQLIRDDEVTVTPFATGNHEVGSSNLQLNPIVNFGWPDVYLPGQIVAVDHKGTFVAYAIVTPGKAEGVVRVVNLKSEQRALLKGMKGTIKDLAFAYTNEEVIIGCNDEYGNVFIFSIIEKEDGKLSTKLLLNITSDSSVSSNYHRIIWCPYMPEDENEESDEESAAKLMVITNGSNAEMWDLDMVISTYGNGPLNASDVTEGRLQILDHQDNITDAGFSPDGTALATASMDGQVKFFQVYMANSEPPRCLHEWAPHDGKPVSNLFFLDDHTNYQPDVQFWKYAITGCNFNSEIKLWSCEKWSCLQTIKFLPNNDGEIILKAALDPSSKFLILSDLQRKDIYVLQLQEHEDVVRIISISEFATPSSFLCMSVISAGVRKIAHETRTIDELNDDDDDDIIEDVKPELSMATVIEFILIQPKSLQSCKISYEDAAQNEEKVLNMFKKIKTEIKGELKEEDSTDIEPVVKLESDVDQGETFKPQPEPNLTLMSPDAFKPADAKIKQEPVEDEILLAPIEIKKEKDQFSSKKKSGGSSPSQEVQDILEDSGNLGGDDYEDVDQEEVITVEETDYKEETLKFSIKNTLNRTDPFPVKSEPSPSVKRELNKSTDWPEVPAVKPEKFFPPMKIKQELVKEEDTDDYLEGKYAAESKDEFKLLFAKMSEMTELMNKQRNEIAILREEVKSGRKHEKNEIDKSIKQSSTQITKTVKQDTKNRCDALASSLTQSIPTCISKTVEGTIKQELKKLTPQAVNLALQSVSATFEQDAKNRISKSDQVLREALTKAATSRSTTDNIASILSAQIQPVIEAAFRDTFSKVLIPAFERGIQNMLSQISASIGKGFRDHEANMKELLTKMRQEQTTLIVQPLLDELREKVPSALPDAVGSSDRIIRAVREVVAAEVRDGLMRHNRSLSATPVIGSPAVGMGGTPVQQSPSFADMQRVIQSHLTQGNFEEAFHAALSANNLPLVVWTCELVNPMQVFNQTPCPISQPSLLSLIQQLGHNLERNTELKHKYLQEAVMALDSENSLTKPHIRPILEGLQGQLERYIRQNPNQKMTKQMKMLKMATFSLVPQ